MADIETLLADTRYFADQGGDPSAPSAGEPVLYTKSGELYVRNSSGIVGPYIDETAHDALDHTGLTGVGGAGSFTGFQVQWAPVPPGLPVTSTTNTADLAVLFPVVLTGPMKVRNLYMNITSGGSGSVQAGLFDASSDPAACTQLAAWSGAYNSTGWIAVAATSAPVSVTGPGQFYLIIKMPAANTPTVTRQGTGDTTLMKSQSSYTWDTSPDITSGWTGTGNIWVCEITGDIDGSNQWG